MPIAFQCSQCSKTFRVADDKAGKKTRCSCGAALQVPQAPVSRQEPGPAVASGQPVDPLLGGAAPVATGDPLGLGASDPLLGGAAPMAPADPLAGMQANPLSPLQGPGVQQP
ncbi:MAG: hypothetical protein VB855_08280, partial [Pirellulaceae bacterium]